MTLDAIEAEFGTIEAAIKAAPPDTPARRGASRSGADGLSLGPGVAMSASPDLTAACCFRRNNRTLRSAGYSRRGHFVDHRDNPAAGMLLDRPDPGTDNRIETEQASGCR